VPGGAAARPVPEVPSGVLLALRGAIEVVVAAGVSGRAVDVREALVLTERLRGLGLAGIGELDATGGFVAAGSVTAAAWLRRTMMIGEDSARAAVRLAGRVRSDLAGLGADLTAGLTTLEHVRAAAAGTAGLDPELVAAVAPQLSALVRALDPAAVRRELRQRADSIDPRLAEQAARRQHDRRGLRISPLGGTGVVVDGLLADEDGAVLLHSLDLALEADRTEGDRRSLAARRADIVVGWARQAAHQIAGPGDTLAQDAHTVRSHLLISCTPDQLTAMSHTEGQGTLARTLGLAGTPPRDQAGRLTGQDALDVLSGTVTTGPALLPTGATLFPAGLRRLACDTTISLIALTQPSNRPDQPSNRPDRPGHRPDRPGAAGGPGPAGYRAPVDPLYVGRSARTISGRQFKALVVRDRTCVVTGCNARPAQCAGHHVQHWLDGGRTDLDNLVLLCHRHHHDHHDRGHDLEHRDGRQLTQTGWAQAP